MVCDDPIAMRAIDEELEKGMSGAALARLMTLRGFEVSAKTVNSHNGHRRPMAPPDVAKTKKDLAILMRDKVYDRMQSDGAIDLFMEDKNIQGAVKVGLQAEAIIAKREAHADDKKNAIAIAILLSGGPAGLLPPPELIGDEDGDLIIEGEARVIE